RCDARRSPRRDSADPEARPPVRDGRDHGRLAVPAAPGGGAPGTIADRARDGLDRRAPLRLDPVGPAASRVHAAEGRRPGALGNGSWARGSEAPPGGRTDGGPTCAPSVALA